MVEFLSDRLALPLLASGQAAKEVTHNEALAHLELAVQAVVVAAGLDVPPPAPLPGQCWIVGAAPAGAWSGHAHALAGWTGGGWRFVAPFAGLAAWNLAAGRIARFDGTDWSDGVIGARRIEIDGQRVLSARQPAVASPGGGTTVDAEARTAIGAVLVALRAHGLIAS